jgi:hypothetical protein
VRAVAVLLPAAVLAACGSPPPATDEEPGGSSLPEALAHEHDPEGEGAPLPLRLIMQGLSSDMARLAEGLWVGDRATVASAASRVAEHPRVTPEQMGVIQSLLGTEFSLFVGHDGRVHDAALALSRDAGANAPLEELLRGFVEVQQGCIGCHAAFQERVSSALAAAGGEGSVR